VFRCGIASLDYPEADRAFSEAMTQYDFEKVIDVSLSEEEVRDQKVAEDVAKAFLHWKPLEETAEDAKDAMGKLKAMLAVET